MKVFAWTNEDVLFWLRQARVRTMTQKEVASNILTEYGRKVSQPTIGRHFPKEEEPDALHVISIKSKFLDGVVKAVRESKDIYRLYEIDRKKETATYYKCYKCCRIRTKLNKEDEGFTLPTMTESIETGKYKLNRVSHLKDCKTLTENEVLAKDLDRKMRDEVRSEETALPGTTWEKYENMALKVSEKKGEDVLQPSSVAIKFPTYEEPVDEVLLKGFGIELRKHDLDKLKPGEWINDNIFHYYLNLIVQRSQQDPSIPKVVSMSTFFYKTLFLKDPAAVSKWVCKVDLFSTDLVLIPIQVPAHWCLAVVHVQTGAISYYDSLHGDGRDCTQRLREYFDFEAKQRKADSKPLTWADSTSNKGKTPKQLNGSDCGIFACTIAEHVARNAPINFSQEDMSEFRRKMLKEIKEKRLS